MSKNYDNNVVEDEYFVATFITQDQAIAFLSKLKEELNDDLSSARIESLIDILKLEKRNIDAWGKNIDDIEGILKEQGMSLTEI